MLKLSSLKNILRKVNFGKKAVQALYLDVDLRYSTTYKIMSFYKTIQSILTFWLKSNSTKLWQDYELNLNKTLQLIKTFELGILFILISRFLKERQSVLRFLCFLQIFGRFCKVIKRIFNFHLRHLHWKSICNWQKMIQA